jgi:hypothetical protein
MSARGQKKSWARFKWKRGRGLSGYNSSSNNNSNNSRAAGRQGLGAEFGEETSWFAQKVESGGSFDLDSPT